MRGFGKRQPSVVSHMVWLPRGNARSGFGDDERRAGHRLDAAGHEQVAVAGGDRVAGADDGGEPGGAETVHGHTGNRLGEPRQERRHAGDIAVVLAGLVGAAEVDVFDRARVDAGALDGGRDREGGKVVGPRPRQRAAVAADRRADGGEDDGGLM